MLSPLHGNHPGCVEACDRPYNNKGFFSSHSQAIGSILSHPTLVVIPLLIFIKNRIQGIALIFKASYTCSLQPTDRTLKVECSYTSFQLISLLINDNMKTHAIGNFQ